jgi:hypothetical protein|tara:strand:+ start:407 stop:661 length:255 start_codon:yes stop_codon:yes gene_type:complete
MHNRFNINEEEKNRIRGLHKNHPIIKEQFVFDPEKDVILERLLVEAQRLMRFITDRNSGKDNWGNEDLSNIGNNINVEITNYLK